MIIYAITNLLNGKIYVGQTTRTLERRFKEHKKDFFSHIGKDIRKFGEENFSVNILEKCKNITELNEREIFWIKKFNSLKPNGYNILPGGGNYKRQSSKDVQFFHRNFIKIKFVDCNESEQIKELKEENENLRQLLLVAQSKLIKVQEELTENQKKFLEAESQSKDSQSELKVEQALHEVTKKQFSEIKTQLEQMKKRGLFDRIFNNF